MKFEYFTHSHQQKKFLEQHHNERDIKFNISVLRYASPFLYKYYYLLCKKLNTTIKNRN